MRWVTILLLLCVSLASAEERTSKDDGKKAGDVPAYIMITEGIVGGFVPARVRQRTVLVNRDGKFHLLVMKQPARNKKATHHVGTLDEKQSRALLSAISEHGLWKLPVESPAGSQDIYGLDTSIAIHVDGKFWRNGGPGGCVRRVSKVQPTKEQKESFRDVVALIKKSALENAKTKGDAKSFNSVLKTIQLHGAKTGKADK